MKTIALTLFSLVILVAVVSLPLKAYTELGTQVNVIFSDDGSAHVTERYSILLDNDTETETFQNYVAFGQSTIIEWKQFLKELAYHVSGDTTPMNTKISASRLLQVGSRSAEVVLDYDLSPKITDTKQVKTRLTLYSFDQSFLSFGRDSTGETTLPARTTLVFTAPADATLQADNTYPNPATTGGNSATWVGPLTAKWRFSYTVEQSLSGEVKAYFNSLYIYALDLVPWLLPAGLLILVVAFVYNKFVHEPKAAKKP